MGIIDLDHSLPTQHGADDRPPRPVESGNGRSEYTYLFPALANNDSASLFPGTSPDETYARLRKFEEVYRQMTFPTLPMKLPAAYTYFGQFVNHDISAPVGGLKTEAASIPPSAVINSGDPPDLDKLVRAPNIRFILDAIRNEQAQPLALDSLYADGPASSDPAVKSLFESDGLRFRLGRTVRVSDEALQAVTKTPPSLVVQQIVPDIPRDGAGRAALIADRRNDENLIVSQMHLALMLLHNKAVTSLSSGAAGGNAGFAAARTLVTQHYHWLILNDFLPNILSAGVLNKVKAKHDPLAAQRGVTMEFTTAAFRFGHSMVSQQYDFNSNFGEGGRIRPFATLHELFAFTSRSGMNGAEDAAAALPAHWVADWERLTRLSAHGERGADRIDMSFAPDMLNHMSHTGNLVHASIFFRNLVRGFHRRIPFGQRLAEACGEAPVAAQALLKAVPADDQGRTDARDAFKALGFDSHTPAWLYFLLESHVMENGQRLGPAASHIIAETIVGLLKGSPQSILAGPNDGWHPRMSPLKGPGGQPLDSLRHLLMFAVQG